jgi:hypothetical protein
MPKIKWMDDEGGRGGLQVSKEKKSILATLDDLF